MVYNLWQQGLIGANKDVSQQLSTIWSTNIGTPKTILASSGPFANKPWQTHVVGLWTSSNWQSYSRLQKTRRCGNICSAVLQAVTASSHLKKTSDTTDSTVSFANTRSNRCQFLPRHLLTGLVSKLQALLGQWWSLQSRNGVAVWSVSKSHVSLLKNKRPKCHKNGAERTNMAQNQYITITYHWE